MKMNFKYAMMACALVTLGLASCSEKDGTVEPPVEGSKAFVQIGLVQEEVKTRANYPTHIATDAEKKINDAKIYIFNSNRVLQKIEPYVFKDANGVDQCRFETTEGKHYFLAVANAPELSIPLGTHMDAMDQYLEDIDEAKFNGYINKTNATVLAPKGFYMTSGVDMANGNYSKIEYVEKDIVIAEESTIISDAVDKKINYVEIPIGRAMAKVEAFLVVNANGELPHAAKAKGQVKVASIKYALANNPDAMYYFPYFGGQNLFQTPFHDIYNKVNVPDSYWPALHNAAEFPKGGTGTRYVAPDQMKGNNITTNADPFYAMENSNKLPTYGNATLLSVEAQFIPEYLLKDATGTTFDQPTTPVTFYRIRKTDVLRDAYIDRFYEKFEYADDAAKADPDVSEYEILEYQNGYCYYIIPLYDDNKGAPECYDVVRNHYFEVKIDQILGCGYNEPGGDKDTEKPDPLDPEDVWMHAVITVKNWVKVSQNEGLGPRY